MDIEFYKKTCIKINTAV